ncbi:hypothetical protein JYG23_03325 [Sedimentibacter sp. zth1]|uniref:hypothetical protein n=1 Tax=Sedimentibacter sp. zth1 TaxID=2816908 RepID=UPI001A91BE46|nr:hypothetical protein [Sedimentibacter sp. zth1]QSX06504.1 hypothetical protein JYG23_03325 [Sedimentibacter sp. zth1]
MNILKKKNSENINLDIDYKLQFTVVLSNANICNLLKSIAEQNINIDGFLFLYNGGNQNVYKFIVGCDYIQTKDIIVSTRKILDNSNISYNEKIITSIRASKTPIGILEDIYCTLSSYVDIKSLYLGEKNTLYLESETPMDIKKILTTYYNIKKLT